LDLKSTLKVIKLNESTISMVLGAVVVLIIGSLVVSYFKGIETGTTLPTSQSTEFVGEGSETDTTDGPTIELNGQTAHIVQADDNLWKIAEKYYDSGYNWTDIANANTLSDTSNINVGTKLIIPDVKPKTATIISEVENGDNLTGDSITGSTYTVEKGDTLWDISVRAYGDGYRWTEIASQNQLANPNLIHSGNIFDLPRP
jgi:nucleoid-associated protein YgaU